MVVFSGFQWQRKRTWNSMQMNVLFVGRVWLLLANFPAVICSTSKHTILLQLFSVRFCWWYVRASVSRPVKERLQSPWALILPLGCWFNFLCCLRHNCPQNWCSFCTNNSQTGGKLYGYTASKLSLLWTLKARFRQSVFNVNILYMYCRYHWNCSC